MLSTFILLLASVYLFIGLVVVLSNYFGKLQHLGSFSSNLYPGHALLFCFATDHKLIIPRRTAAIKEML